LGRLITEPVGSGFVWNKTSESRCSYVAICLQMSVRILNGKGVTSPMRAEGCTERTIP
jgi:hypothetical protein